MPSITFTAHYGDKTKQVKISLVHGTGGNYDLMIDKFYRGQLYIVKGKWAFSANVYGDISGDDITVLLGIMEDEVGYS